MHGTSGYINSKVFWRGEKSEPLAPQIEFAGLNMISAICQFPVMFPQDQD